MMVQISSGMGPIECEYAVGLLLPIFLSEIPDSTVTKKIQGKRKDCYSSVILEVPDAASITEGTIKWSCESPFRPGHKRKNWFIDICLYEGPKLTCADNNQIRYETFRCGGKGGQNVNKVETGVRAIHLPTGFATVSTTARTQLLNKKLALNRLMEMIGQQNSRAAAKLDEALHLQHEALTRGNPIRIYEGEAFKRVK